MSDSRHRHRRRGPRRASSSPSLRRGTGYDWPGLSAGGCCRPAAAASELGVRPGQRRHLHPGAAGGTSSTTRCGHPTQPPPTEFPCTGSGGVVGLPDDDFKGTSRCWPTRPLEGWPCACSRPADFINTFAAGTPLYADAWRHREMLDHRRRPLADPPPLQYWQPHQLRHYARHRGGGIIPCRP